MTTYFVLSKDGRGNMNALRIGQCSGAVHGMRRPPHRPYDTNEARFPLATVGIMVKRRAGASVATGIPQHPPSEACASHPRHAGNDVTRALLRR